MNPLKYCLKDGHAYCPICGVSLEGNPLQDCMAGIQFKQCCGESWEYRPIDAITARYNSEEFCATINQNPRRISRRGHSLVPNESVSESNSRGETDEPRRIQYTELAPIVRNYCHDATSEEISFLDSTGADRVVSLQRERTAYDALLGWLS